MVTTKKYFKKQASPQKEICLKLRQIILTNFPNAEEQIKWGVPTYNDGQVYIVGLKDHVNMGISIDNLSESEKKQLQGNGQTMRHLKFYTVQDINEKKIIRLLSSVFSK